MKRDVLSRLSVAWSALRGHGVISGVAFVWHHHDEMVFVNRKTGQWVMKLNRLEDGRVGLTFPEEAKIR